MIFSISLLWSFSTTGLSLYYKYNSILAIKILNNHLSIANCNLQYFRNIWKRRLQEIIFLCNLAWKHESWSCDYFRDSRHSINASPEEIIKPSKLNQTGTIIPFMVTSQTKSNRRRCIKAISENTIIAMVVNGFMIRSSFFHNVLNIAYLFPVVLHSSKKYITGVDNKEVHHTDIAFLYSLENSAFSEGC